MKIFDKNGNSYSISKIGQEMLKIPSLGDVKMDLSLYCALNDFGFGRDIIIIGAFIFTNKGNLKRVLGSVPKSPNGDFESLVNFMN